MIPRHISRIGFRAPCDFTLDNVVSCGMLPYIYRYKKLFSPTSIQMTQFVIVSSSSNATKYTPLCPSPLRTVEHQDINGYARWNYCSIRDKKPHVASTIVLKLLKILMASNLNAAYSSRLRYTSEILLCFEGAHCRVYNSILV